MSRRKKNFFELAKKGDKKYSLKEEKAKKIPKGAKKGADSSQMRRRKVTLPVFFWPIH